VPLRNLILLLTILTLALVAKSSPGQSGQSPTDVKKWIADLDSDKFATRQRASNALRALKLDALTPLEEALKEPGGSLERCRRVQRLIGEIKVFERDGEPVSGLRLTLMASNDTLGIGEQMTLRTTLTNVGKDKLHIRTGCQIAGDDFIDGGNLHCLSDYLQAPEVLKGRPARGREFVTLPPGASVQFLTSVTLRKSGQKDGLELDIGFGASVLELPAKGSIRLRVIHSVVLDAETLRLFAVDPALRKAWTGTVRSNDVDVKLIAD
jgi:hypothetical protein